MSHDHYYSMPYPEAYPTYVFDDSSNVASMDPLTEGEVDNVPPVKVITEIDSDDWEVKKRVMMTRIRTPTGNYPKMKKSYPLMGMSQRVRESQKRKQNLLTLKKIFGFQVLFGSAAYRLP